MTKLLINIDHVATLRNARRESFPDPVEAALACERAGADGIVFHLREDRRHIEDEDVDRLRKAVTTKLDFELSLADEIVAVCCRTGPQLATIVPERRQEITTEGGLDVAGQLRRVRSTVARLQGAGVVEVALFVDAEKDQIDAAAESGANAVELHTGDYANADSLIKRLKVLQKLDTAARRAKDAGLTVHAGHGLDYENVELFLKTVPSVVEVSIGFAIIARSLFTGLEQAVADMVRLVKREDAAQ